MSNDLYQFAYEFLLSKPGITKELIEAHLIPEYDKPNNLNDIFKRLCYTAQNKQMSNKVIGNSIGGVDTLKKVLFNFNPKLVAANFSKSESEKLLDEIISTINPKGQIRRTSRSIWPQFCQSVIDSAHFLNAFKDTESFYNWADGFANDEKTKAALPLLISIEVSGIGFPLACDFLKEIGYINFGKPDVHLKEVFKALNLIDPNEKSTIKQDYQTIKCIDKIAIESNTTSFKVDKIFWLIGSGNFYLANINIGRNRNEFIKEAKKQFLQNC